MSKLRHCIFTFFIAGIFCPHPAFAQIDPAKRELIQVGYGEAIKGEAPLSGYAFYYYNRPDFLTESNLTLRLAIAPVYLDSELGISQALGPETDVGLGLSGGGFADSYYEVRQGHYFKEESFFGDGVSGTTSIYHLFDPGRRIPLHGLLRFEGHFANYSRNDTAPNFELPKDQPEFNIRTGLRFGGKEPVLVPNVAMELSLWYEGQFRFNPGDYGYHDDRHLNSVSHLFWSRALLAYTLPESKQNFLVSIIAGESIQADRFSAYRLGGFLPLAAEFPLSLPGYFYQELSATRFASFNANYSIPIDPAKRFAFNIIAGGALVQYLPGLEQPGHWNSGVGGGLSYHSHSDAWQIMLDYAYGFEAIRDTGRGGQTVALLFQINLERTHPQYNVPGADHGIMRTLSNFTRSIE